MRQRRQKWIVVLCLLVTLVGVLGWLVYAPVRQERLNCALIDAIKQNETQAALVLLAQGADPNSRDEPAPHLSLWKLLLDKLRGKRPNASHSLPALLVALRIYYQGSYPPNPTLIQELLDSGADVNARDENGDTPVQWALVTKPSNERDKIVYLLLEHRADVNALDKKGFTPFTFIFFYDPPPSKEILSALLNGGADVNAEVLDEPALMQAVEMREPLYVIKLLLQHGANPNLHSGDGGTVLSVARKDLMHYANNPKEFKATQTIIQMLWQAGARY